ncbi:MAG: phosphoglycerate kinase [Desulfobacterota bacterium]|nr:phosphoglycerate kinase [Thermodesulfobacteriota bacterium]
MEQQALDPRLPLMQQADLQDKIVLLRVDHNVVKKGVVRDPYRIEQTFGTLYNIVERGGRPILITHQGRPRDKKTGEIACTADSAVDPVVRYLEQKLHTRFFVPTFAVDGPRGIPHIDTSVNLAIRDLRRRRVGGIYLPNSRWFQGEEGPGAEREAFARELAGLADVFINDAFGSWQPHASTYDITRYLPAYAGFLMQKELSNLDRVLNPERPFLAVVAGAKYDTKIGPLTKIYEKVDQLILGGVIYNTYLAAKLGLTVAGVSEKDVEAAKALVALDAQQKKIVELPLVVESDTLEGRLEGRFRTLDMRDFRAGDKLGYLLDVAGASFDDPRVQEVISRAKTIFVNAVMGFTPHFTEGSKALDQAIDLNREAFKMYGGGDTLQEFKDLNPGLYLNVIDDTRYYFFTGGGTVLTAIESGTPYGLKPIQALMENGGREPR